MKRVYKVKKTISIKRFLTEFGEEFSEHIKERLLDLEVRCVLTRKEQNNRLDIKHVEHTKYDCETKSNSKKEYDYGQFLVIEGILYYSEGCTENADVMQSPVVNEIFNSLNTEDMVCDSDINAKKVDDSNIDYVIDTILKVCPEVSQKYLNIVNGMLSRAKLKRS